MVYFILGILILLFYLFLAKLKSPKGFKNHVTVYFFCLVVILEISTKAR